MKPDNPESKWSLETLSSQLHSYALHYFKNSISLFWNKKISPGISLFSEIIKMFFISIEAWKALLYPEIVTLTLFADIVVHKDFFNQAFSYPCWIITCFHFLCEAIFASWAYSAVLNLCATFQFVLRLPFYKYGPKYVSYWMRLKH